MEQSRARGMLGCKGQCQGGRGVADGVMAGKARPEQAHKHLDRKHQRDEFLRMGHPVH